MNTRKKTKLKRKLSQLPKELVQRVINNKTAPLDVDNSETPEYVIGWVFRWIESPEGGSFWSNIQDTIFDNGQYSLTSKQYKNIKTKHGVTDL